MKHPAINSDNGWRFDGLATRSWRQRLLTWYDHNRRDLPWRRDRDPYRVWISEIMLQQTRVSAVLEHYRVFLERCPKLRVRAAASESSVLAVWSGLAFGGSTFVFDPGLLGGGLAGVGELAGAPLPPLGGAGGATGSATDFVLGA